MSPFLYVAVSRRVAVELNQLCRRGTLVCVFFLQCLAFVVLHAAADWHIVYSVEREKLLAMIASAVLTRRRSSSITNACFSCTQRVYLRVLL